MIALWRLLATLLAPWVALGVLIHPRLRAHARERLGFPVPTVEPGAVWVHAASLGEGRAAAALLAALRARRPELALLRTATSPLGRAQEVGADQALCLPVDVPFCVGAWLDRVRPRALVLVEAELWPCLLWACRRRGIPVTLVEVRLGPGLARLRRIPGLWAALLAGVRVHAADAATAAALGVPALGSLKAEAPRPPAALTWGDRPAVIAGSTREGDEAALLAALRTLDPRPLLVLAPREPARFERVAAQAETTGLAVVRRSRLAGGRVPAEVEVVVLDSVGELAGLYPAARAAFVGGTFDPALGGHSPAEAAAAGLPVVRGPHVRANAAAWAGVDAVEATSPAALGAALAVALGRPPSAPRHAGAADRVVDALGPVLDAPVPAERPLRPWLWPLSGLWTLAVALRPRPLHPVPVPVIAVGALTAGGAGKTPVAGWLAAVLADRKPAVVSRGYGRDPGVDVRTDGPAARLGDEATMLRRRGVRVATSPDRRAAIAAVAREGAGVVILDDALQYGEVARRLEVVVVDARWPLGGGPIPVGTRRVPLAWLGRADVVWVNHGPLPEALRPHLRPDAVVVRARYRAVGWTFRGQALPLDALPPRPVVAFAGIARPAGFFAQLRAVGVRPTRRGVFPDHHRFTWAELQNLEAWLDDHVVVTTEKDAARLPADAGVYALRVELEVTEGEAALRARLAEVTG